MTKTQCPCQSILVSNNRSLFEDFASLRKLCPALRDILVPDTIWHDFREIATAIDDQNRKQPIVLGAFKNGLLNRITLPVHTYLLDGPTLKCNLTRQYKEDLSEKWILKQERSAAYQKLKTFKGKLTEIMVAAWLADYGWTINNLEALGGSFDI